MTKTKAPKSLRARQAAEIRLSRAQAKELINVLEQARLAYNNEQRLFVIETGLRLANRYDEELKGLRDEC